MWRWQKIVIIWPSIVAIVIWCTLGCQGLFENLDDLEAPEVHEGTLEFDTVRVTDIDPAQATFEAMVYDLALDVEYDHGFCWSTTTTPTLDSADGDCHSLGNLEETGPFFHTVTDLQPGQQYFVQSYVRSDLMAAYGQELEFQTTAPAIQQVEAVFVEENSTIELSWSIVDGAEAYVIHRDGEELTQVEASTTQFTDETFPFDNLAQVQDVQASQGEHGDAVIITWPRIADHLVQREFTYVVSARYPTTDAEPSPEATAFVDTVTIYDYEVQLGDGGIWVEASGVDHHEHQELTPATVDDSALTFTASQGTYLDYVELAVQGWEPGEALDVSPIQYRIRAVRGEMKGQPSDPATGWTGPVEPSFEWEAVVMDEGWQTLAEGQEPVYRDETAPADGTMVQFAVRVTVDGEQIYTLGTTGYRLAQFSYLAVEAEEGGRVVVVDSDGAVYDEVDNFPGPVTSIDVNPSQNLFVGYLETDGGRITGWGMRKYDEEWAGIEWESGEAIGGDGIDISNYPDFSRGVLVSACEPAVVVVFNEIIEETDKVESQTLIRPLDQNGGIIITDSVEVGKQTSDISVACDTSSDDYQALAARNDVPSAAPEDGLELGESAELLAFGTNISSFFKSVAADEPIHALNAEMGQVAIGVEGRFGTISQAAIEGEEWNVTWRQEGLDGRVVAMSQASSWPIYAGTSTGQVIKADLAGSVEWSIDGPSVPVAAVRPDRWGNVFAVWEDGTMRRYDEEGNMVWETSAQELFGSAAVNVHDMALDPGREGAYPTAW